MKNVFVVALILGLSSFASAAVWDLNTDMDTSVVDNGIWSYGYGNLAAGTFTALMDSFAPTGELYVWYAPISPDPVPHIFKGEVVGVPAGMHGMNGGSTGESAVVRWTAPTTITDSQITIDGIFAPVNWGLVDVAIVKNETDVLLSVNDFTQTAPVTIDLLTSIAAGDTIDFHLGPSWDGAGSDWTSVSFTITSVPEPVTISLLGLGSLVLMRRKRR